MKELDLLRELAGKVCFYLFLRDSTVQAAWIAVGGVMISVLWARKQHRKEVELDLRKDTYLEISDAFAGMFIVLGEIVTPFADIQRARDARCKLAAAVGKVHIVAGREIRAAICDAYEGVLTTFLDLSYYRAQLDSTVERIERRRKASEVYLAAIKEERDKATGEDAGQSSNVADLKFIVHALEKSYGDMTAAEQELLSLRDEARQAAFVKIRALGDINRALLGSIRRELNLPEDAGWFKERGDRLEAMVLDASKALTQRLAEAESARKLDISAAEQSGTAEA